MNTNVTQHDFAARDGARLVYRVMDANGVGDHGIRTVILLHGLFSSAEVNWIKYGHAAKIASAGFRVVMPDLRAHGDSAKPHDEQAYPADVLAHDVADLIAHLGVSDYDLGGFSLGARTSARAVLTGAATPRRLILAGMGLEGLAGWARRRDFFLGALNRFDDAKHGEPEWLAIQFMKTMKVDRDAARLLLGSMVDTEVAALADVTMPTLVICGDQDNDNGSAPRLAETLPNAHYVAVPGTHMSSVTEAALGNGIAHFLTA